MYQNKKIMIIGGTGTIGKMLLKALIPYQPAVIRIFSRDEHKQFELQQEFLEHKNIRYLIGDIRDLGRLTRAMEDIDYVFHCAAMKHVPSCEYNPFEAVQTNVIGTQNVIQAAIQNHVLKVLFTSTDKAISPTNTYGATKLTAERLISAAQNQKGSKPTIFSSVRFGNVMGSRGSVIPLFRDQILRKREITVTRPDMIRYMMTPNQAIKLMLEANERASGGEVFVLKMPLVNLADLADTIIELVCNSNGIRESISIRYTGLRPGEKMFEELMTELESSHAIELPAMYVIPPFHHPEYVPTKEIEIEAKGVYQGVNLEQPITKEVLKDWIAREQIL